MNRKRTMLIGSLIGDAYALGTHWIYDTAVIDTLTDQLEGLMDPAVPRFHQNRKAGEHTHYGDQTLLLLRSVAAEGEFSRDRFAREWREMMSSYDGYRDHATSQTLADPEAGSSSDDLGGPARIAPLVFRYWDEPERMIACAEEQTAVTHNSAAARETARSLAEITCRVIAGASPAEAVREHARDGGSGESIRQLVQTAADAPIGDSRGAVLGFGQMCSIRGALPSALSIILACDTDLREALRRNVLAGGDSAARGLVIGMVIGASGAQVPDEWLRQYRHLTEVSALLDRLEKAGS
jgi:ADP-ribosylglycohydrolase